jgi:hypothetical protein
LLMIGQHACRSFQPTPELTDRAVMSTAAGMPFIVGSIEAGTEVIAIPQGTPGAMMLPLPRPTGHGYVTFGELGDTHAGTVTIAEPCARP